MSNEFLSKFRMHRRIKVLCALILSLAIATGVTVTVYLKNGNWSGDNSDFSDMPQRSFDGETPLLDRLRIGMTKEEVMGLINKEPDCTIGHGVGHSIDVYLELGFEIFFDEKGLVTSAERFPKDGEHSEQPQPASATNEDNDDEEPPPQPQSPPAPK